MNNPKMHQDRVWFSMRSQFEAFDKAFADTSPLMKLSGRYKIPPGAAYLQSILPPWTRLPIVMVADGALDIDAATVSFTAVRRNPFGSIRRNVQNDLRFELGSDESIEIADLERRSPVSSAFDMPWTLLRTSRPGPLNSFYLAVGGRNGLAMALYREESLKLRRALRELVESA